MKTTSTGRALVMQVKRAAQLCSLIWLPPIRHWIRPFVVLSLLLVSVPAFGQGGTKTSGPGGAEPVDWSPGSAWVTSVNKLPPAGADKSWRAASPAFGREKTKVKSKLAEQRRLTKSNSPSAGTPQLGSTAVSGRVAEETTVDLGLGEQSTTLIEEIALELNYEPLAIFNWMLTKVEYVPYFGLYQGAHVTALEMQGNDYDQCVLLVSLLKHAGVPASDISYVERDITYTAAEIDDWLKWDLSRAGPIFSTLGIPLPAGSGTVTVRRVTVSATIDGVVYQLDPAFKHTVRASPVSVAEIYPGYSASALTVQAGGSAPSDDQVSGMAVDAFQTTLSTVASGYVRNAAQTYHGRDARSILGLPVLDSPARAILPITITQPNTTVSTWPAIPDDRGAKITFNMGSWSRTYQWCDLANDVFTIRFGTDGRASLYREDQLEGTEAGTISGDFVMGGSRFFPQAPTIPVSFASTAMTRSGHSLVQPVFESSRGRLKQMTRIQADMATSAPTAESTLIHTLALVGLQRAVHEENGLTVVGALNNFSVFNSGSVWFVHERNAAWWVDGPQIFFTLFSVRSPAPAVGYVWDAMMPWTSATEHLALEQMSPTAAKSTVAVFESALRSGKSIFRLRPQNWAALIGQITGGVFPGVETHVLTNNQEAFVTSTLQIPIYGGAGLNGKGAFLPVYYAGAPWNGWWASGAWLIDGGFNGGGSNNVTNAPQAAVSNTNKARDTETADGQGITKGADPVDLNTGAFMYEAPGLKLGNGSEPTSLDFRHFYSTAQRLQNTAQVGLGWTHSYDIFATKRHATDIDIRTATVAEIAPFVIAMQYLKDVVTGDPSAKEMALRALTVNWTGRQLMQSKATVALGQRRIEFHRLADGTYIQSSSVPATFEQLADGSYRLAFRHGNTISFQASDGRATSIVDANGNSLSLSYLNGKLDTVTDAYARTLTFSYGTNGLTSVTDSTGRVVSYGRVGSNFTISVPDGGTMTFSLNGGEILSVTDASGRAIIVNLYDSLHRVWAQQPLGDGQKTTYLGYAPGQTYEADAFGIRSYTTFDPRGRRTAYRDALGQMQTWTYDGADRLTKMVTARGATSSYGYDANHVLTSETNPAGNTRTIVPDGESRPWKVGNFEGKETVFTYTTQHQVETTTAPGGIVTSYTYDGKGRVLTHHPAAYATGEVMTYAYDIFGNIDTITFPGASPNIDDYTYNARGDLTELVDRRSAKTTYGYDARRLRTSVTQWQGTTQLTTQTFYTLAGDVDYILDASGRKTDFEHDALGNLLTVKRGPIANQVTTLTNTYEDHRLLLWKAKNALNQESTFVYDNAQRLTDTYDPLSRRTQQGYDADSHPTTVTTPLTYPTTTVYTLTGWKDGVTDAESQTWDYGYDKDGRLTSLANRLNKSFTWIYNDDTRTVTSKTPLLKPTVAVRSTRGLLTSVQEPSAQTTTYTTYDAEGRLTQKTDGVGSTSLTYWPNGLPKEVTENGHTSYRGYDELNRLNEYRDGEYRDGEPNALTYEYHASGELWKLHYPGGRVVTYDYDAFGRLWHVTDWASRQTAYTYDNASRLTRIDRPNGTYRTQDYDAAGQMTLIQEFKSDGSRLVYLSTGHDLDGRITSLFLHPKPASFALPQDSLLYDEDNRLSTWNGQPVTRDEDGNMTNGPLPSGAFGAYVYDSRNRLTSAGGSGYRYNPDGQRVEITGTGAATFVVDPNAGLSRVLMRTKAGTTTYYVYGLGLLYEDTNGATKTYHCNQVGSTLAVTDGSQNVTDRVGYSPFGTVVERSNPAGVPTDTPFLFNGEFGVMNDANGLLHMRARYYHPRLGRFCNADPIGFDGGLNWYAAFGNNPVSNVDPDGQTPVTMAIGAGIGFAVGFGVSYFTSSGSVSDRLQAATISGLGGAIQGAWVGSGAGFVTAVAARGATAMAVRSAGLSLTGSAVSNAAQQVMTSAAAGKSLAQSVASIDTKEVQTSAAVGAAFGAGAGALARASESILASSAGVQATMRGDLTTRSAELIAQGATGQQTLAVQQAIMAGMARVGASTGYFNAAYTVFDEVGLEIAQEVTNNAATSGGKK